ncbi:sulfotransferase family protein [Sphaerisporangium corydalis]|uniref:Sulfotransferase family protein n=1 Tax=Sphaerisporangium corydalis TaxID=1441875 RepID=A0ABV9ENA5_9ACTN|nr:sulfotransferase [Sphaerisporangium corydalis]
MRDPRPARQVRVPEPSPSGRPGLIFLIGTGRCGSTLLYDMLAHHPHTGFTTNLDERWGRLPAVVRRLATGAYRRAPSLPRRVRPSEAQSALARDISPMIVDSFRDLVAADVTPWLAARSRAFFEGRAALERVDRYLHKFTGWPRASFLHEVFPDARFVHILRDGRAVASSWSQMPWWRGDLGPSRWDYGPLPASYAEEWDREGRSMTHLAGIGWKVLMDAYGAARASVPSHLWLDIRYEDLVADPRKHTDVILSFLGLPWTAQFERRLGRTPITLDRTGAFREDLSPAQVALLNRSLGAHLTEHGYSI